MLCAACEAVFNSQIIPWRQQKAWLPGVTHQPSAHALFLSSKTCQICRRIWQQSLPYMLNQAQGLTGSQYGKTISTMYKINAIRDKVYTYDRAIDDFDPPRQDLLASETRFELLFNWSAKVGMTKDISYQLLAADESSYLQSYYDPAPYTDSASMWSLCRKWVDDCLDNHKACKSASRTSSYEPTRLLELISKDAIILVRLIVSKFEPPDGPYMTLSHCWGDSPVIKLTQDKEQSFRHNIGFDDLPALYQEAVTTTVRMGIKYLWIDSLCIIQDEPHLPDSDWMREASIMGSVYSNSFCNIAASAATDSLGSLFFRRNVSDIKPLEVVLQGHAQGQLPFYLFPTELTQGDLDEPLSKRAWVLQEQLLAPRTLLFTATQVRWECRSLEACESLPGGIPDSTIERDLLCTATPTRSISELKGWVASDVPVYFSMNKRGTTNIRSRWEVFCINWKSIVEEYTRRYVTISSDKMSALGGIATALSRGNNSRYVAGLWHENFSMCYELCWSVGKQADGQPACRPKSYRAPTWSWASMDGAISYHTKYDYTMTGDAQSSYIQKVEVKTIDGSPFGQIESGFIELEGPLRKMWHKSNSYGPEDDIDTPSGNLYIITMLNLYSDSEIWGLALRKIENGADEGCYRRVGTYHHRDTYSDAGASDDDSPTPFQLFYDAPKQLVRII